MFGKQNTQPQADLEFFTVFDSKSKSYDEPVMAINKDTLLRDILNSFRNPEYTAKAKFFTNAEDYSIFRAASYNKKTGVVTAQPLEHIVNLHDLKALAVNSTDLRREEKI